MRQALDKISTNILRYIPFILALFVPLFFLPNTLDFFAFNKYYFIAVLGTISLIAWCVRNLTRNRLHFTTSPALYPIVALIIVNIISSVWISPIKHVSLFGQTALITFLGLIFITVTSSQKNEITIKSIIAGLVASASFLSLFTVLHYFGLVAKIIPSDYLTSKMFNPAGGILPALSFTLPVLIATVFLTTKLKNWIVKSTLFASILLMIVGSIINFSLILPQNGVPVISLLPFAAGWSIAVDTFKTWQTALFGTGPETFFSTFTRLRPSYLNLDQNLWSIRFSESSNIIFTLITTTGVLGVLAFIFTFLRPVITVLKDKNDLKNDSYLTFFTVALIATIISFLIIPTGVISFTLGFVLLIGLVIELKYLQHKSVKDIKISLASDTQTVSVYHEIPQTTTTSFSSSFLPWLVSFLSVALIVSYWIFASKTYLASVSYKEAVDTVQADAYGSFLKYQKSVELDPFNPYYPQKLSQIYLAVADSYFTKEKPTEDDKTKGSEFAQRALDAGKISAKIDQFNVTTWENLTTVYRSLIPYAQGSADLAVSHNLQAISLDPTNPVLYLQLGTLFFNLGDADQATKLIDRAIELKQNWDLPYYNLSSIYKIKKDYTKALQYARAGLQYTDPKTDTTNIQAEIKSLEKLVPSQTATQSATPQQ